MSEETLFSIAPDERLRAKGRQWSPKRAGTIAELLATAELLQRGHHVAVPVVDDDGIDLVVDYKIRVQIKSSTQITKANNLRFTLTSRGVEGTHRYSGVDIWVLYSYRERRFYVVPGSIINGKVYMEMTRKHLVWTERWDLFKDYVPALVADAA